MSVFGARVNPQLAEHVASKGALWKHAFYSLFDNQFRLFFTQLVKAGGLQTTRIAGMMVVQLVGGLVSGHLDFAGIDYNNVIARIHVRGIFWFMFSTQATRNLGSQSAQGFALGIDQEPVMLDVCWSGTKSLHLLLIGVPGKKRGAMVRIGPVTVNVWAAFEREIYLYKQQFSEIRVKISPCLSVNTVPLTG